MNAARRNQMMFRWSLTITIATALFWVIWWLAFGDVPSTKSLQFDEKTAYDLPFAVSRWWDVVFAPLWTAIFVYIISKAEEFEDDDFLAGLGAGLVAGLVAGLGVGLGFGLGVGLVVGLGVVIKGLVWVFSLQTLKIFYNWLLVRS